jgi:hypothetical protein
LSIVVTFHPPSPSVLNHELRRRSVPLRTQRRLGAANSTTPSGGVKSSGCDRPVGPEDMETYLTIKSIPIAR